MYTYQENKGVMWVFSKDTAINMQNVSFFYPVDDGVGFKMVDGSEVKIDSLDFNKFKKRLGSYYN